MYFPYFRGRQYELLALKELVKKNLLSKKVVPVIEPVKISSTLESTLKIYNENSFKLAVIANPQVGELVNDKIEDILDLLKKHITSIIFNKSSKAFIEYLEEKGYSKKDMLIILDNGDYISDYKDLFDLDTPLYTLLPDERRIRRSISNNKVLFEDRFNKQPKNADYLKNDDEMFSEDHLYYSEENYVGFGDYSIIGNYYDESGFSPRAVAIHIVYFDKDNTLRVHHFVSDSNYGTEDIANKYYEAVVKLKKWFDNNHTDQLTSALSILLEHAESGYYPGLPTIKKLSIMHHLELISKYLDNKEN